jgi:lysophospholipase L1-like esterase
MQIITDVNPRTRSNEPFSWRLGIVVLFPMLLLLDTAVATVRGWRGTSGVDLGVIGIQTLLVVLASLCVFVPKANEGLRRSRGGALLMIAALILAWTGAEFIAAYYVTSRYHLRPASTQWTFQPEPGILPGIKGESRFSTNSLGIRGPELPEEESVYRILCVGGSSTECLYLDDTEAWPQLLMRQLNATGGGSFWVGNAGISGYATEHHLKFAKRSPLMQRINCLVLLVGINDFARLLRWGDIHFDSSVPIWRRSAVIELADTVGNMFWLNSDMMLEGRAGCEYELRQALRQKAVKFDSLPALESGLRNLTTHIEEIVELGRKSGVRVVLLTQPTLWRDDLSPHGKALLWWGELPTGEFLSVDQLRRGMDQYNEAIRSVSRRLNIECIDLSSMDGHESYFYDDCHFNEAGARETARLVAEGLLARERDREGTLGYGPRPPA